MTDPSPISDTLSDIVASMASATELPKELHRPAFMPDLLVAALTRHADKPAVYLGDEVLTGSQVAAEMSRYVQAYASLGISEHHPIAMLSKNRPEVLFTMGANMLTPCRQHVAAPDGIGRRPGLRARGRRRRDAGLRPDRVRGARGRAARPGARA